MYKLVHVFIQHWLTSCSFLFYISLIFAVQIKQRFPTLFVPFPPWCLPKVAVFPLTQSFNFCATLTRHNSQKHIRKWCRYWKSICGGDKPASNRSISINHSLHFKAEHHCHHFSVPSGTVFGWGALQCLGWSSRAHSTDPPPRSTCSVTLFWGASGPKTQSHTGM